MIRMPLLVSGFSLLGRILLLYTELDQVEEEKTA